MRRDTAINIGTGDRFTLNQTLALLEKHHRAARQGEVCCAAAKEISADSQADIGLAKEVLGIHPAFRI